MKKLFVILLLLVTINATSQNKTVVLKVASVDASNYLTKADSLSGGYTSWLLTKKKVDSLGSVKVNISDTTAMLKSYKKANVIAWGNSLTYGYGATSYDSTYPSQASIFSGLNFVNKGISGETATEIKNRLYAASADTLNMSQIFWIGENTSDTARITSALDSMILKINHSRYLVVSIINRSTIPIGNSDYDKFTKWNADAAKKYGNHFLDLRTWMLSFGDGSGTDNTDILNGVCPSSLRVDIIHYNDKGYRIVAQRIIQNVNVLIGGDNNYFNSIGVSSRTSTPIFNGNSLYLLKVGGQSYINSYSATPPYVGGDTLNIQNSSGVINLIPNGGKLRTGFLPARTTAAITILTRGSDSDTSQFSYASTGQIASASSDIIVTNGTNVTVNKNVDLALSVINTTAGTYGSATQIPVIIFDNKGRIISGSNVAITAPAGTLTGTTLASNVLSSSLTSVGTLTSLNSGAISTTAGSAINANSGSLAIAPSATRGVINLGGTTDNFLTFANKGYLGVGATYFQVLAQTGVALSFVSDAASVLSFGLSGGTPTFNSLAGTGDRLVQASSTGALTATTAIASGTYTPTASNSQNCTSLTAYVSEYMRVGNIVTVSGLVSFNTSASGVVNSFNITLPITTSFSSTLQAHGTATDGANYVSGFITSVNGTSTANVSFKIPGASGTAATAYYTFQYQIL
jgi:lysophospholipase L1-like esterase